MKAKLTKVLLYLLFIVNFGTGLVQAQVHTRRFRQPQNLDSLGVLGNGLNIPTISLNAIPTASLLAEDEQNVAKDVPFRFGINRDADIDIMNTATNSVKEGFTVFEYRIDAEKALSLNLIFDRFRLKEGAKMFLYNSDRTMLIGPITAAQNPDSGEFWTDIVQGSSLIIEVQEPLIGNGSSDLHISSIIHGYHNVFPNQTKAFGDAGSCHPNMICYPDYQVQGDGVAMILTAGGSRICTGSMINNMRQSFRSYFLTANHCTGGGVENWLFRFNYQSTTCTPGVDDLDVVTLNGATYRSSNANSDFALLELTQQVPPEVNTTYNGWNRAAATTSNNFGIHHPRGDLKKISFTNADTQLVGYNGSPIGTHLIAFWGALGNTDPGSSGSPLFDGNLRIVGQLHGGPAFCGATGNRLEDYYGRFYTSWTGGGANNNRLSNWLDPDNSSAETTDGVKPTVSGSDFLISAGTFSLNTLNSSVVSWSVQDGDGLVSPTSGTGNSANLTVIGNGSAVKIIFSVNDGQSYPIQFAKLFDTALPATASSNSAICEGSTLNLIGTGNGTFEWSGPSGFSSTNQNPSITNIQPTASGYYKLTVTNVAAGYTSVDSTLVTVFSSNRLYVNKTATGANNGKSWTDAFTDLQAALNLSCPTVTEIWVAKGMYKPTLTNGDRNLSFNIRNNLKVYGGFAGTEVQLSNRDYSLIHTTNSTTLSGDLNGDDGANFANNTENSDAVVRMSNVTNTTRLDGFSISGGNNTVATVFGGGISLESSNPIIANCSIIGNHTDFRGGGISNALGQPSIENCSFYSNRALYYGGAMYNLSISGTTETINISNSIFVGNSVVTNSGSILFNFSFAGSGTTQNVNLTNCSFSENTSPNHGIFNLVEVAGNAINTNLKNCVFFNNGGNKTLFNQSSGGGISTTTANHSLFQSSVTNFTGSNNVISDISPFVSGTDLHLPCGSLAANSGTNSGVSVIDLDGNHRTYPGTGVDMGAYELQGGPAADPTTISVSSKEICLPANVTLTANCAVGFSTWYAQAAGGTALGTGTSFVQSPSANTTYYVECSNVCAMGNRLPSPEVIVANSAAMLSLTSDFNANSTQIANTTLTATNKIIDPAKVIYKAGNSVTLNQGFEANNGSTFLAQIGGCENVTIPGLVAYYPFNGNANDESTNNNNGVVNGATLTTDRFGNPDKAYSFDGVDDRINANVGAEMYSAEKTISVWAMVSGAGNFNPRLVGVGPNGSSAQYYSLLLEGLTSPRRLWFFTSDAVSQAYSNTLVQNSSLWNHYTVTYKSSTVKIYINGILDSETAVTGSLSNFSSALLQIGYSDNSLDWFDGKLDDLRIYNRGLSDAEIQAIYNAEKPQ